MPKLTRTKVVKMDGAEVTIAPLTVEQIEAYVAPLEDLEAVGGAGKIRTYDLVCNGLNNALPPNTPEEEHWTHATIRTGLDLPLLEFLRNEILSLSGFKFTAEKVAVPGESTAVAEKGTSQVEIPENLPVNTSGTSAAA